MLLKHSAIYIVARILPAMLGLATTAVLTHLLPPRLYGLYGLALVVMSFGANTTFDWLGLSFMRFYQSRREDPSLISTFVMLYLSLVGITGLLAVAAWMAGLFSSADSPVYAAGIVLMWTYSWFDFVSRYEIANFRPHRYLMMNLGRAVFTTAGAIAAAWTTHSPIYTAAGTAVGSLMGASLGGLGKLVFRFERVDWKLVSAVFAFGLPMAASMTMGGLVNGGTRWLIQDLDSTQALGYYTAAFMLVQNTLVLMGAGVASAGYSLAVRAVESGDPNEADRQLRANSTLLMALLMPAAIGLALTAQGLASTLVGKQYVHAVAEIAPWMAAGTALFTFRANHLDHAFQLGRRPDLQVWVSAGTAIITIGLSLWLIPTKGSVGAAMAMTAAMTVSCVHAWVLGYYGYKLPFPIGQAVKIALACAVMTIVVIALRGRGIAWFASQVILGGITYLAAAVVLDVMQTRSRAVKLLAEVRKKWDLTSNRNLTTAATDELPYGYSAPGSTDGSSNRVAAKEENASSE